MHKNAKIHLSAKRYSFLIGIIVLIYLFMRIGTTGYLLLANGSPNIKLIYDFPRNEPQQQLNDLIFYWGNNLSVGLKYFILHPLAYFNFVHVIDSSYSNFNDQYAYGAEVILGRVAAMSVHDILEFVGITLMTIGGILFWALMISRLSRRYRRFALKKSTIIKICEDALASIVFGVVLIVIAGPIEAFLSWPYLFRAFSGDLLYSIMCLEILVLICIWVFFIKLEGWKQLRSQNFKRTLNKLKI